MVKTDALNRRLMQWETLHLPDGRGETTITIDGKAIHSTLGMKNMNNLLHVVNAQICEPEITPASEAVNSKSNEIPSVQALSNVRYGEDYCHIENRTVQQKLNLLRNFP